ncbi:MAG: adenosylcobinamide-GDP ribazoletransferase [Candidatus Limivicinus sp.]|jgi:adenosylcobinamide-GDP ribazoletransferase
MFFKSMMVAFSTYSIIPVPQFEWTKENVRYALCFFPAVGLVLGLIFRLWYGFCLWIGASAAAFAAVGTCLPLLISGGIHMDGFMDTVDALASHQSRERKLEILKDPGCGAFAVIYCGVYLLMYFGILSALYESGAFPAFCAVFVISRSLSGLCAVSMKNARGSGMLCAFTENTERRKAAAILSAEAAAVALFMLLLSPVPGICGLALGLLSLAACIRMAKKQFGGVTGDTSGFFLQIFELSALLGFWTGVLLKW